MAKKILPKTAIRYSMTGSGFKLNALGRFPSFFYSMKK